MADLKRGYERKGKLRSLSEQRRLTRASFPFAFARSLARSFVYSLIRLLAAKRANESTYAGRCGAPASANRYALSSSLLLLFSGLSPAVGCPRFPTPSVFVAGRFLARRFSAVHTPRDAPRRRFYLIALLCFIEQLLRSRTVCFFFFYGHYRKQLCL